MSTHPFGVEASDGRLCVSGEVDLAVAAGLLDAILSTGLAGDAPDLIVDLREVTFIDSTGIGALIEGTQRLRDNRVELRVANPSPFVAKVIEVSGVAELFGVPPVGAA